MKVIKIPISKINIAKYNPRKNLNQNDKEYQAIKKSIEEFDLVEPLVWNERTGNLVGGHQRLKVLMAQGENEVDVSVVNLPLVKEKALNIALNKVNGEWENNLLKDLLFEIDNSDFDIGITGFSKEEIKNMMTANVDEEFTIPEMELKTFESYDYIVVVFKNTFDWLNAIQKFGISKVDCSFIKNKKKIGIGRVVDGTKFLKNI